MDVIPEKAHYSSVQHVGVELMDASGSFLEWVVGPQDPVLKMWVAQPQGQQEI